MPKRVGRTSSSDTVEAFTVRRRHLPHWEEPGRAYFITFTLRDPETCGLCSDASIGCRRRQEGPVH